MQISSVETAFLDSHPPFSPNVAAHDTAFAQGTSLVVPSGYCTFLYQQLTLAVRVLVVNRPDIGLLVDSPLSPLPRRRRITVLWSFLLSWSITRSDFNRSSL